MRFTAEQLAEQLNRPWRKAARSIDPMQHPELVAGSLAPLFDPQFFPAQDADVGVTSTSATGADKAAGAHPAGGDRTSQSKYHNVKTEGEASKRQAKRLRELRLLNDAGKIRGLARQVEYVLVPKQCNAWGLLVERNTKYIADFVYEEQKDGCWTLVVEDAKGYPTPDYIVKRKLMLKVHGISIRET